MTIAVASPGTGWRTDLLLGLRLAMGARRSAWLRLVLTALGTAIGVVVLLFAASVPHIVTRQHERSAALSEHLDRVAGVQPLRVYDSVTTYHGDDIDLAYLGVGGPRTPRPPGVSRLPRPGEVVLSPALRRLLDSSAGALLRPRFPQHRIGTIGPVGLHGPADLVAYVGVSGSIPNGESVYGFGTSAPYDGAPLPLLLWVLLVVGVVVLLFPVFVFVATASRLAGAERDRRLAAIRLIGADSRQIRRIAAGDALLGSVSGLLLGGAVFLAVRPLVEYQTIGPTSVFTADVVPALPLVALIAVALPVLAVGASLFALRRTMIEPLGVVRQVGGGRRRLWWRLALTVVGAGLLALQSSGGVSTRPGEAELVAGVVLLLLGIPALLPWLLQLAVGAARRGSPALQLAKGRLRLDSGTPARVVAGVAVVLAGSVALFGLLDAAEGDYGISTGISTASTSGPRYVTVTLNSVPPVQAQQVAQHIAAATGVTSAAALRTFEVHAGTAAYPAVLASCATIDGLSRNPVSCRDGDVFSNVPVRGTVRLTADGGGGPGRSLRLPQTTPATGLLGGSVVFTPGALGATALPPTGQLIAVAYQRGNPDAIERVRNAVAGLTWRASVNDYAGTGISADQKTFATVKRGLYAGALLTLGMAAATMLVLAIEQVAERRRPLAVLAASGVPRAMLARSILWQNAIPLAIAVVVADATGLVLGSFLLRIAHESQRVAWSDLGILTGVAVAVVAVATALTLPAVRRATRPTMLRAE